MRLHEHGGADATPMSRLDARIRIALALVAGLSPLFLHSFHTLGVALVVLFLLALVDRVSTRLLFRRFLSLNVFMTLIVLTLPWSIAGKELFSVGSLTYSTDGLHRALIIALRGNTIVLGLSVFLHRLDPVTLGHGLEHFHIPRKFTQIFLLSVRYLSLLEEELGRVWRAMQARAFRVGLNRHGLKSLGYLVGTVLVRAHDRAHRIRVAMAARAFSGHFPHASTPHRITPAGWATLGVASVFSAVLIGWEQGLWTH